MTGKILKKKNKLGLGTVQFGCNYGISNKNGMVELNEAKNILNTACESGIDTIDTAHLYGSSEEVLGKFNLENFKVVTKTAKIDNNLTADENIRIFKKAFTDSLKRLNLNCVYGLLFHQAQDILSDYGTKLWIAIQEFKKKKHVQKIGVSVYTPEQLINIMNIYDIDIVQLPLNILDQRFVPMLSQLKSKNIEIHTRSTFLQGLLLMDTKDIDPYFDEIKPLLAKLPANRLSAALNFADSLDEVDKIIVGTTKKEELEQIIKSLNDKDVQIDFNKFAIRNEKYIIPSNWKLKNKR